jgi:hypothetical protein
MTHRRLKFSLGVAALFLLVIGVIIVSRPQKPSPLPVSPESVVGNQKVRELQRRVPPPQIALHTGEVVTWERVESNLGIRLPSDYKEIIDLYGEGFFTAQPVSSTRHNAVYLFSPFAALDGSSNLGKNLKRDKESIDLWLNKFPEDDGKIARVWPEVNGVLPIGTADNGTTIAYQIRGADPDKWTLVSLVEWDTAVDEIRMGLADFFVNLLDRKIQTRAFPVDYFEGTVSFRYWALRSQGE